MAKKNSLKAWLRIIEELGKVRISIPVAFTTFTGYAVSHGSIDRGIVLPVLGIFLLACGASAFNQLQEFDIDQRMHRTHRRPIPSGRVDKLTAFIIAMAFTIAGATMLLSGPGFTVMLVGLLTLLWYNLVYTPLKRITAFAAVPGGMVGALPPVAGWIAGGGSIADAGVWAIAFYFFMGQVPHFWLLLLKFGEEYAGAGLPSLTNLLSGRQIRRLTFVWIVSTGISALALPAFGVVVSGIATWLLVSLSFLLIVYFLRLLSAKEHLGTARSFVLINVYYLLVMLIMIADSLFRQVLYS